MQIKGLEQCRVYCEVSTKGSYMYTSVCVFLVHVSNQSRTLLFKIYEPHIRKDGKNVKIWVTSIFLRVIV